MMAASRYLLVLLMCVQSVVCIQCTAEKTSPPEIIGVWTTDDDNHEGESIEFTNDRVIMSSASDVYENTISRIESSKGHIHNTTLYTIDYIDSEGENCLLNVLYSPEDGGTLRMKALQDVAWKRE